MGIGTTVGLIGARRTKTEKEITEVKNAISLLSPTAQQGDIGKALILKTVDQTGKPTSYEYGNAGDDPSVIEQKVNAWLNQNISNPDSPPLDRTLTFSNAAMPADIGGAMTPVLGNDIVDDVVYAYGNTTMQTIVDVPYMGKGSGTGLCVAFDAVKHCDYVVNATNNNRLRVYGMYTEMSAKDIPNGSYETVLIDKTETSLSEVAFNSGSFDVIIVYLKAGNNWDNIIYSAKHNEYYPQLEYKYCKLTATAANADGTVTLAHNPINTDKDTCCVFTPIENNDYILVAKNNNRLRVYGSHKFYDPKSIDIETVCVELIINADSTLTGTSFNSGKYKTIFVYLHTGLTPYSKPEIILKTNKHSFTTDLKLHKALLENNKNDINAMGVIPFISDSLPVTAVDYHAAWDDLVDAGFVSRSTATYMSTDTDHDYPLYTYTVKRFSEYMTNYQISENDLSTIYARPKILVVSGHHGDEPCAPWALLHFFKRLFDDKTNMELLAKYEWTIIPLVNPVGYNNRSRYNGQNKDINRDYNDSSKFLTEEAQYVRDVFLSDSFAVGFDLHQSPFQETDFTSRMLGFAGMSKKRGSDSQDDYDKLYGLFCRNIISACARTDRSMMLDFGYENIGQVSFIWDYPNSESDTFTNYASGQGGNTAHTDHHTLFNVAFETSTRCSYLAHLITDYNDLTVQYTNVFVDEVIKAALKTYESVS